MAETVEIRQRTWQRTCDALNAAERENVELRKRLRLWEQLSSENGWVDAEAVNEAMKQEAVDG